MLGKSEKYCTLLEAALTSNYNSSPFGHHTRISISTLKLWNSAR